MCRRTAGLLAVSIALIAPSSVHAAAEAATCARSATVTSGAANVMHFHQDAPEGEPLAGETIKRRDGFFRATGMVKLEFVESVYTIKEDTIFKLGCYGKSREQGAIYPALELLKGGVALKTAKNKPGGIVTAEALVDPRRDPTMQFQVSRTLSSGKEPTMDQIGRWFADTISQPKGTTRATTYGKPIMGVTPYVGAKPGTCRYVHGAKLTTKGTKGLYFTGTATYTP